VEWYNPKPVEVALYVHAVNDSSLRLGLIDAIKHFEIQSLLIGKPDHETLIVSVDVFVRNISELDALVENINSVKSVQKISRR
jgi:(p)ppGpp synthase/HD superfamily hydrolase